jgi:hypothetical protein
MTRPEQAAALVKQGLTEAQIGAQMGLNARAVRVNIYRARAQGLLPDPKPKTEYNLFRWKMQSRGLRMGRMHEILGDLTEDQRLWLADEAQGLGCDNIAEYICEIIRDAHAESVDSKRKAA